MAGSAQIVTNILMLISEGQLASAIPILSVLGAGVIFIELHLMLGPGPRAYKGSPDTLWSAFLVAGLPLKMKAFRQ